MDTEELFQILIKGFSQEELNTLYFELDIDYKNTTTLSKSENASNLLKLVQESGRFAQLLAIIKQQRPHLFADQMHVAPRLVPASNPTAQRILAMDRMALYNFLVSHLNNAQIRTACSELGIDEKQLSGSTKAAKARELIVYLENENRLPDLRERLVQHISGKLLLEDDPFIREQLVSAHVAKPLASNSLADQIAYHLSQSEFKTLCFDLGIDYDDLPGTNDGQRTENLISVLTGQQQMGNLLNYLNREHPTVSWGQEF
jgi:vacuolar-type H+-ATPase subunit C/Vma6